MNKAILALLIGLLSFVSVGCGDSGTANVDDDFVATGTNVAAANTGTLVFGFTRPQTGSVPLPTTQLTFNFYDSSNTLIFTIARAFATQVTISNVPTSATRVEILATDTNGYPLAQLATNTTVTAGISSTIDLSGATSTTITYDSITVTPNPVAVNVAGTQQVVIQLNFSNGTVATLNISATTATITNPTPATATVSATGLVTGVAAGTVNVTFAVTVNGVTRNSTIPVNVT